MQITSVKVTVKTRNDVCQTSVEELTIEEVLRRIEPVAAAHNELFVGNVCFAIR